MGELFIGTINIRSLTPTNRHKDKTQRVIEEIRKNKYDITLIQDTHTTEDFEYYLKKEWDYKGYGKHYCSHGTTHSAGVVIFVSNNPAIEIEKNPDKDTEGRRITIEVIFEKIHKVNITAIYAPSIDQKRSVFLENLRYKLTAGQEHILGGDFNFHENLKDKMGGNPVKGKVGCRQMKVLKEKLDLSDPFRKNNPAKRVYTWTNNQTDGNEIKVRLDRFYSTMNGKITHKVCTISDHDFCEYRVKFREKRKRGPGLWILNTSILEEPETAERIQDLYDIYKPIENSFEWDLFKKEASKILREMEMEKKNRTKDERNRLSFELDVLESSERQTPRHKDRAYQIRKEMEKLDEDRWQGARIRAKIDHIEQ